MSTPAAAVQRVGAAPALQDVVAAAAGEDVGQAVAGQRVAGRAAGDVLDVPDRIFLDVTDPILVDAGDLHDKGGFELTGTSGAIGKCVRWGYRFWEEKPGGPPLHALHQACIHMTRAEYGGDGSTFTRDGTIIYMCDRFGVRPCVENGPMQFEAAWGVDGAVCVARPRVAEITTLEALAEKYPGLASHLGANACREESAIRDPAALLFNRSGE